MLHLKSLKGLFSYALLVCLHGKQNIHTCCIFVTSRHSVSVQLHDLVGVGLGYATGTGSSSRISSRHLLERRHNHTRCICETSLHDVVFHVYFEFETDI